MKRILFTPDSTDGGAVVPIIDVAALQAENQALKDQLAALQAKVPPPTPRPVQVSRPKDALDD